MTAPTGPRAHKCHCGQYAPHDVCTACIYAGCLRGAECRRKVHNPQPAPRPEPTPRPVQPSSEPVHVIDPHGNLTGYSDEAFFLGIVDAFATAWIEVRTNMRKGETSQDRTRRRIELWDWALEEGAVIGGAVITECRKREAAWLASL